MFKNNDEDSYFFFFQAEDGIRDFHVTGVQTCALPISSSSALAAARPTTAARAWRKHWGFRFSPEMDKRSRLEGQHSLPSPVSQLQPWIHVCMHAPSKSLATSTTPCVAPWEPRQSMARKKAQPLRWSYNWTRRSLITRRSSNATSGALYVMYPEQAPLVAWARV